MSTGIEMMLKAAGIDVQKAVKDFEQLKSGVTATLETIDARLKRIEQMQGELWKILTSPKPEQLNTPVLLPIAPKPPAMPPAPQPEQPNTQP